MMKINRVDILELLFYMGYYGHDEEEDKEIDLMSDDELYNYYLDKSQSMDEEEDGF